MVPYLLSEDQKLSLLFLVFYICKGWHNISDDSLSFHQRIQHENAFIFKHLFFSKLKFFQTISMEFYLVFYFKSTRNLTHHSLLPPDTALLLFFPQSPFPSKIGFRAYKSTVVIFLNRSCRRDGFLLCWQRLTDIFKR